MTEPLDRSILALLGEAEDAKGHRTGVRGGDSLAIALVGSGAYGFADLDRALERLAAQGLAEEVAGGTVRLTARGRRFVQLEATSVARGSTTPVVV